MSSGKANALASAVTEISHVLVVDQANGPFTTLTAAKAAAEAGDTIVVSPGTYTENDLLKDGVNWLFLEGAIVDWNVPSVEDAGYGIFDDRASGPVTCNVSGRGVFKFHEETIYSQGAGNGNTLGMIVITNAGTSFSLKGAAICAGTFNQVASGVAIYVQNALLVDIEVDLIKDVNWQTLTAPDPADGTSQLQNQMYGLWWVQGETYLRAKKILCSQYSIWAAGPDDSTVASDLWVTADYVESTISGAYYASGQTGNNYRVWLQLKEIVSSGINGGSNIAAGGRHYIVADKIITNAGIGFSVTGDAGHNPSVWLTAQKLSATGNNLRIDAGTVFANILQFEDLVGVSAAVNTNGGELHLCGGYAKVLNGVGINHTGGAVDIFGLKVDTTNTNHAENHGVKVSGPGLVLRNCVLRVAALADSVNAAESQMVTNYGSVSNKNKHANVIVNVQPIIVDASVV
jgi:hypothetical protein